MLRNKAQSTNLYSINTLILTFRDSKQIIKANIDMDIKENKKMDMLYCLNCGR